MLMTTMTFCLVLWLDEIKDDYMPRHIWGDWESMKLCLLTLICLTHSGIVNSANFDRLSDNDGFIYKHVLVNHE